MNRYVVLALYLLIASLSEYLLIKFLNMGSFYTSLILSLLVYLSIVFIGKFTIKLKNNYLFTIPLIVVILTYVLFSYYTIQIKLLLLSLSILSVRFLFYENLNWKSVLLLALIGIYPFYLSASYYLLTSSVVSWISAGIILFASMPFKLSNSYYGLLNALAGMLSLAFLVYGNIFLLLISASLLALEFTINRFLVNEHE